MSSRGAAQFRIGSCAYHNMVLRFSICPAFARLFLRRRCNFSWVLTHRLQPRVFFHPNAVYDPAAYALGGAAPFRIGPCAHCNMVLHFSRLSSVAVLRRICLARKRCSFSWTLARRLPSRVSLFLPSVAYDFTAYALARGYAVPHQAMYISQHGSAAQRVCQLR